MAHRYKKKDKMHVVDPLNDVCIYDMAHGYIRALKQCANKSNRRTSVLRALATISHIAMEKDWKSLESVKRHIETVFNEALKLMVEDNNGSEKE